MVYNSEEINDSKTNTVVSVDNEDFSAGCRRIEQIDEIANHQAKLQNMQNQILIYIQ